LTALPRAQRQRKKVAYLSVSASAIAEPADIQVLAFGGETRGSERLALKVADPFTAKGLVHRCLVTEKQNSRRVSEELHFDLKIGVQ
jgi:hypothetical protein